VAKEDLTLPEALAMAEDLTTAEELATERRVLALSSEEVRRPAERSI
jgi:hypothetical protein